MCVVVSKVKKTKDIRKCQNNLEFAIGIYIVVLHSICEDFRDLSQIKHVCIESDESDGISFCKKWKKY